MRILNTVFLLLIGLCTNLSAQTSFSLSQSTISCGEQTCLQVTAQDFDNILSFQFSMNWDAAVLSNASVQSFGITGLNESNFNISSPGIARVGWDDANLTGVTLPGNEVLFEICYEEIGGSSATTNVQFASNPVPIEVVDAQGNILTATFQDGAVIASCDTDTGGNTDNPPTNSTSDLTFSTTSSTTNCGEQVCVDINVQGFTDISSFQYSMNWDAGLLGVATVQNFGIADMTAAQFNATTAGILRVGYDDSSLQGVSLTDGSALFQVCFNPAADVAGTSNIDFSNTPIAIEVVDIQTNIIEPILENGSVTVNCDTDMSNPTDTVASDLPLAFLVSSDSTSRCGEQVCLNVSVQGFTGIGSFQYSLNWDFRVLGNPVVAQTTLANTRVSSIAPGSFLTEWRGSSETLDDNTILYQVCFDALGTNSASTSVEFASAPIPIIIMNDEGRVVQANLEGGNVVLDCTPQVIDTTGTEIMDIADSLAFIIMPNQVDCETQVCVDVTTKDFNDLATFQYSIKWDALSLGSATVQNFGLSDLTASNFNTNAPGILRVGWDDATLQGVSVPDDQILYQICFDIAGNVSGDFDVNFSNDPVPQEVVDVNGNIINADYQNGIATTNCDDTTTPVDTTDNTGGDLRLILADGTANCGEQICLDVTAQNFNNLSSFQYSLNWDATALGIATVQNFGLADLTESNFNLGTAGIARVGWDDSSLNGISVPNEQVLYQICFNADATANGNFDITFSDTPIAIEIVDINGAIVTADFQNGTASINCDDTTTPVDTTDNTGGDLRLILADGTANCGEQICLDVTTQNFNNLSSFQYSLNWDATALGTATVQNFGLADLTESNFNLGTAGIARVGWDDSSLNGISIPNDQVLYQICFNAGATANGNFDIAFSDTPIAIEIVDINGAIITADFQNGTASINCDDTTTPVDTTDNTNDVFNLILATATVECGEQICLDVRSAGFTDIISFQYSINWDATVLDNAFIQQIGLADMGAGNFNTAVPGVVRVGWTDPNLTGVSMADNEILYQICFDAIGDIAGSTAVEFTNSPLPIEVLDVNSNTIEVELQQGNVTVLCTPPPPVDTTGNIGDNLTFVLTETSADCADQVCMEVSVFNFTDIISFQYSMNWDAALLGTARVESMSMPDLNAGNFNNNTAGVLRVGWDDSFITGVTLPDNQVIYQICFDNITSPIESTTIEFTGNPTSIEVVNDQSTLITPDFQNGILQVTCGDTDPGDGNGGDNNGGDNGGTDPESDLTFSLSQINANCGEQMCMDVSVQGFKDILTYQYSIVWDAATLGRATVQSFGIPDLNVSNFNNNTSGILRVGWDDSFITGVTLPDDHIIYQVCFDAIDKSISNAVVQFANTPTSIEVVDRNNQLVIPVFENGSVTVNCEPITTIDADGDGFSSEVDCDDTNAAINSSATEIPNNGIDEDCNGSDLITNIAVDNDGDGFAEDVDCDDNNSAINPNATEVPNNNVDEDCDGIAQVIDADNDGFNSSIDCDDNNAAINGNATEIANNGIDEDCDGADLITIVDNDGDGFTSDVDCDDNNASINPGAIEVPNNNDDEDCDGIAQFFDADNDGWNSSIDCDDNNPAINGNGIEIPNNGIDEDCDGVDLITNTAVDNDGDGFTDDVDCDDNNSGINPGATEVPNNNVDEDCDGIAQVIDADNDGWNSSIDCDDNNAAINGNGVEIANNGIDEDCDGADLITIVDNDGDGFTSDVDCDDNNASINPGAIEVPNNNDDEDCDGIAQFFDADNDGWNSSIDCDDNNPAINGNGIEIPNNGIDEDCDGSDLVTNVIIDNDGDGFSVDVDCDDNNAGINASAEEIPNNGIDEDCNGSDLITNTTVDNDGDGFADDVDCDDNNSGINPGATEVPNNNVDEDCDGIAQVIDADNDGFNSSIDCDDNNAAINGNATEIPNNGIDEDCNGSDLITNTTVDNDGDGFADDVDCDDNNSGINPGAIEVPNNNVDEDCDGIAQVIDADNDGFNSSIDCDDNNAAINGNATEIPNNGIDEDCNGSDLITTVDNDGDGFADDVDCDDNNSGINPGATEVPNNNVDEDCDGIAQVIDADNDGFNSSVDCDDNNAAINGNATEIPNNGIDEDCNGSDLITTVDNDGDGFADDVDCDDNNSGINPGATEVPNNDIDEDCDGTAQVIDADNDGFNSSVDCDDNNAGINPGATEVPNNGIDEDCSGSDLITTVDNDGDGFADDVDCDDNNSGINPGATEVPNNDIDEDCDGTAQVIDADNDGFNSSVDCDDNNAGVNPGATEIPNNGIDEDCSGADLVEVDEDAVIMTFSSETAACGEQVCLNATVDNFNDLISFQYAIRWDTLMLDYTTTQAYNLAGLNNSGFFNPANGVIRVSWFDNTVAGITVPNGEAIFQICFDVIATSSGTGIVELSGTPIPIEVVDVNGNEVAVVTVDGTVDINCGNIIMGDPTESTLEISTSNNLQTSSNANISQGNGQVLLENKSNSLENVQLYPNPTHEVLNILLEQPLKAAATLRVYDVWGKLISTEQLSAQQTTHAINLSAFSAGVYLIEIQESTAFFKERIIKQ